MSLIERDGRELARDEQIDCDVVIVGSGPAGAAAARELAQGGARVVILEEGPFVPSERLPEDGFTAMAELYRDMGTSLLLGSAPMPFVQGRAVGGTSVVNGAISWRLPRDVYDEWIGADPALSEGLPWPEIERRMDTAERDLHIHPTEPGVAGPKNELLALAADRLGLEHRPILRNAEGCRGLGRCLQGCPIGAKLSMERTYLPDAVRAGARIWSSTRAERIEIERGAARSVLARAEGGGTIVVRAGAVVLAASAVQTPALLLASGVRGGPIGRGFMCHPGVSMGGWFKAPVRAWTGATQGHEVTHYRRDGIKLEVLGYDLSILAARLPGVGTALSRGLGSLAHVANWGAAIRARATGRVTLGSRGRARVRFSLLPEDILRVRRGVRILGELMLEAGAEEVFPGVYGAPERVRDRAVMARFEEDAPARASAYSLAVTHMFSTAKMGSDPGTSVVRPDFRLHSLDRLYVADSSVFPSNTGVNPQTSILALAAICGARIAARG